MLWGKSDKPATVNVRVDGTIKCDEEDGVGIRVVGNTENIQVTTWAITLNEDGAVAYIGERGKEESEEFNKSINYIIKVEQTEGATLTASGETAHEGETVTLKVDVHSGWVVTGATNGLDEPVELLRDENGNYFVVVPRGGAVYLRVSMFAPEFSSTKSSEGNSGNNGSASLCASIAEMIMNAAPGATVTVNVLTGSSLCKMAVDALEARPDVTLIVNYAYNGGIYSATITPRTSDLSQYRNAVGGIDFETLTVHFDGHAVTIP